MLDQAVSPYAPPRADIDSDPTPAGPLTLAAPRTRQAAAGLDGMLLLPMVAGGFALFSLLPPGGEGSLRTSRSAIVVLAATLLYFAAVMIYQVAMLTQRGQTFGKRAMKIRIVKLDGSQPGFVHAVLLRMMVNGLPPAIPMVGRLYTLVDLLFIFSADRRCLHDRIAGTRVVQA